MIIDLVRSVLGKGKGGHVYPWGKAYIGPPLLGVESMPFEVPIGDRITELKIDLAGVNHLHLANILFKVDGKWLALQDYDNLAFEQSSVARGDKAFDIVAVADGSSAFFSTRMEEQPYLVIRFPSPIVLQALRVVNRKDGLWERARSLRINAKCGEGWRCFYDGSDLNSRLAWLDANIGSIEETAGCPSSVSKLVSGLRAGVNRPGQLRSVLDSFFSEFQFPSDCPDSVEFLGSDLAYLLANVFCFYDSEMGFLTSRFVVDMLLCHGYRRDAFKIYSIASRALSREHLEVIEADARVIGEQKLGHPLIAAAHTFARPLSSYPRETLLDTIDAVAEALADCNWPIVLCYGTLLGFYRDNDFIAHDDDIDLLCIPGQGCGDLEKVARDIVTVLGSAGFRAQVNFNNRRENLPFVQVFSRVHKVHVDIFLAYSEASEIFLPMRNVNYSSVPASILLPVEERPFFGRLYSVPAKIEEFLAARYGATWRTPDKHFRANEHGKQ
ncbi:LicD family protein [Microbulbifer sp. YPW16]|uniref:LicD family protein n=1 Tax=Microbulbifer sp. YPW16 TaxID=2904242 RepID=UPI001E3F8DF5|nr:LicD family protein [Microbulbifer sp. YPW16]UHQ55863.1 LicD family protein [Microbulbifer sp. YPW16]